MARSPSATTGSTSPVAVSSFKVLPAELRNMIYRYVLVAEANTSFTRQHIQMRTALLRTCRQIRSEATSMFFVENTFSVVADSSDYPEGIVKWLELMGKEKASLIADLIVDIYPDSYSRTGSRRAWFFAKLVRSPNSPGPPVFMLGSKLLEAGVRDEVMDLEAGKNVDLDMYDFKRGRRDMEWITTWRRSLRFSRLMQVMMRERSREKALGLLEKRRREGRRANEGSVSAED